MLSRVAIVSKLAGPCFCSMSALRHHRPSRTSPSPAWTRRSLAKPALSKWCQSWNEAVRQRERGERIHLDSLLFGQSIIAALLLTLVTACGSTSERMEPLKSVQALQYYPFLVKGYENTYPKRRIMVLGAVDTRDFRDNSGAAHAADNGNPAIGVIRDRTGE